MAPSMELRRLQGGQGRRLWVSKPECLSTGGSELEPDIEPSIDPCVRKPEDWGNAGHSSRSQGVDSGI